MVEGITNYRAKSPPEHASIPITVGGRAAISTPSLARDTLGWRSSTVPPTLTPCTAKTFFARSIPVAIMAMELPLPSELMNADASHLGTLLPTAAARSTRGGEGPSIR